jgi:hypothetical protein
LEDIGYMVFLLVRFIFLQNKGYYMKKLFVVAALLTLAGCMTPEQRAARQAQQAQFQKQQEQAVIQMLKDECIINKGILEKDPRFASCMRVAAGEALAKRERAIAEAQLNNAIMQNQQQEQFRQNTQPYYVPKRNTVTCNGNSYGNASTVSCY